MEVNTENGVSNDVDIVLEKWKNDFSQLFNRPINEINTTHNNDLYNVNQSNSETEVLNNHISVLEVLNAVNRAKNGKAWGCDNINLLRF